MKAMGTFAQGIAAYDSGKYTRKVMDTNARNALNDSTFDQERIREQGRAYMGAQLNSQAASGFAVGTGTALDELKESAVNRELEILVRRRAGLSEAQGFKQQGDLAYYQGKNQRAGAMLSGVAQIADDVAKAYTGGAG